MATQAWNHDPEQDALTYEFREWTGFVRQYSHSAEWWLYRGDDLIDTDDAKHLPAAMEACEEAMHAAWSVVE